jgi:phosphoribosylformylglycinamidine cyclo-ligase
MTEKSAYARAGVNIAAATRAKELMRHAVRSTFGPEVLSDVGAFGGLFDAARLKQMDNPVLVASTDGVGTKTQVAARLARWDGLGHDIVNHCANDILVQGARPLFFLDYLASSRLNPEQVAAIVEGIAQACRAIGCALLGGETAEMPGVYHQGAVDIAGTIIGVVERGQLIDGRAIRPGDAILGLPSNGLHTNGYSLARAVLDELDWRQPMAELGGRSVGEALLAPHQPYAEQVARLRQAGVELRGLCHITGGGLIDNPPRIFPAGIGAEIRRGSWPEPPIFGLIGRLGGVSDGEMFHVFNMGLGMLVIIPRTQARLARAALGEAVYQVGEISPGPHQVRIG